MIRDLVLMADLPHSPNSVVQSLSPFCSVVFLVPLAMLACQPEQLREQAKVDNCS